MQAAVVSLAQPAASALGVIRSSHKAHQGSSPSITYKKRGAYAGGRWDN